MCTASSRVAQWSRCHSPLVLAVREWSSWYGPLALTVWELSSWYGPLALTVREWSSGPVDMAHLHWQFGSGPVVQLIWSTCTDSAGVVQWSSWYGPLALTVREWSSGPVDMVACTKFFTAFHFLKSVRRFSFPQSFRLTHITFKVIYSNTTHTVNQYTVGNMFRL